MSCELGMPGLERVGRVSVAPGAEPQGDDRSGCLLDPAKSLRIIICGRVGGRRQVAICVLEGRLERVQPIVQRIDVGSRDDDLPVTETERLRLAAGLVVSLATAPAAVLLRSTGAPLHHVERPGTPAAPPRGHLVSPAPSRRVR